MKKSILKTDPKKIIKQIESVHKQIMSGYYDLPSLKDFKWKKDKILIFKMGKDLVKIGNELKKLRIRVIKGSSPHNK